MRAIDFFRDSDTLRSGRITKPQFIRGVGQMCPTLSAAQLEAIANAFAASPDGVHWRAFCDAVDAKSFTSTRPLRCNISTRLDLGAAFAITTHHLYHNHVLTRSSQSNLADSAGALRQTRRERHREGAFNDELLGALRAALDQARFRVAERRCDLKGAFTDADPARRRHVSEAVFVREMSAAPLGLTTAQVCAPSALRGLSQFAYACLYAFKIPHAR